MKLFAFLFFLVSFTAGAHELQPGFLQIAEQAPGRYDVLWRQPPPLRLTPVFPATCSQTGEARGALDAGAWTVRASIQCDPPLAGQALVIEGLEGLPTDVLVRVQHAGGAVETHLLKPERPSITLGSAAAPQRSALAYLVLGIEHIALGVDHLLFVLGLLLIVRSRWMLVKTITAFTVSHSIALAAATFSVISVPAAPLNAAIALSILFLGPEIVRTWRGQTSFTLRHPWAAAFLFGLLHGFGFASGLTGLGLPRAEIPLALLLFNIGVEIGQLAFIAAALALVHAWKVLEIRWPLPALRFPGYVVGTAGAFWTITTVLLLFPTAALAHEGGAAEGLASGFLHPLSGPDHIAAMIAVGLWGAQLRAPAIWLLPVAFPLVMALGGLAALLGAPLPGVEIGIALSAIALGVLVALRVRPPLAAALAVVAVFAVFHGYAHGAELAPGANAVAYSLGFVVATGLLHACGILLGFLGHITVRAAGALVACAGVYFLLA